jgi:integrase
MWVATLDLGWTPEGKRKRWVGKSKDKGKALAKLRDARKMRDEMGTVAKQGQTVASWLDYWLEDIAKPSIRPKTYLEYERCVRLHLKPRLGKERLALLTPQKVRAAEVAIAKEHTPATANNVHRCLRTALAVAEREGEIGRNPAALVSPPKAKRAVRGALTASQAREIIAADETGRWTFSLLTGTRQGEGLGLEWDRLDLDAGTADISWQLQRIGYSHGCGGTCGRRRGGNCPERVLDVPDDFETRTLHGSSLLLTRPKTTRSTRLIPLAPPLIEALLNQRDTASRIGLVWTNHGKPIDPKDDALAWDAMLKALELPDVPLHSTRHTTATLLMEMGVDAAVIQAIMGHTDVTTTRGYQHTDLSLARKALDGLGENLGR